VCIAKAAQRQKYNTKTVQIHKNKTLNIKKNSLTENNTITKCKEIPLNHEKRRKFILKYHRICCGEVISLVRIFTYLYTTLAAETRLADGELVQVA
jgi:hypothetical protein